MIESETTVTVLHDHYKETFSLIRGREIQRDRLLLWLIALVGLLFLMRQYPELIAALELESSVGMVGIGKVPMPVLISVVWTALMLTTLKYCQIVVWVDRQYVYLHLLEETISSLLKDEGLYRREGKVYSDRYPLLTWWAWFVYTLAIPILGIVLVLILAAGEWLQPTYSTPHLWYDTTLALATGLTLTLYKLWPAAASAWKRAKRGARQHPPSRSAKSG